MNAGRFDPSSNSTASSSQVSQTAKASGKKRKTPEGNKSAGRSQNKPTAKKGATSSSEITESDMAIYKAIQAKLKGEKKAAAASHDEGKIFQVTTSCSDS
jgi:hypothetical protein